MYFLTKVHLLSIRTRNWYDQLSFESIETFNDVAVRNEYQIVKEQGGDVDQLLEYRMENRDNSRTPMQWNDSTNGGFTEENLGSC